MWIAAKGTISVSSTKLGQSTIIQVDGKEISGTEAFMLVARVCFIYCRPPYLLVVAPRFPIFKKFLTNRERVSCS